MDKRQAAQDRVNAGEWIVDHNSGTISNRHGRQLGYRESRGYVVVALNLHGVKRHVLAHHVVWESANGPVPKGLELNHINGRKDDNRLVNLEAVTTAANLRHALDTGLRINPYGEAKATKLTTAQVVDIRRRAAAGTTHRALADKYGLSRQYVGAIVRGLVWRHCLEEAA